MENYKVSKENALASVRQSVSSIFTKEDVLYLIDKIEVGSSRKITTVDVQRAIDKTISWMENNERDVVDLDSVEFEISYNNQLSVCGVPLEIDNIREALENNFMDFGEVEVDEDEKELEEIKRIEEDNN